MKTHIQRTLEILQSAGPSGVHSFKLNALVGTTRSAARIDDLKRMGYAISAKHELLNGKAGVRYTLVNSPVPNHQHHTLDSAKYEIVGLEIREIKEPRQESFV